MKKITLLFLLFISSSTFAQWWTLQTTIPAASGGFNSVCAVSPISCWICGASTQVYRTTNGGTTWLDVHGNLAGVDAYSIFALDSIHAWIGAGDGSIYYTVNGGTNWTFVQPTPASPFIDVVHMFDLNNGFAIGDPVSSSWRYYITTNGGATFTLGTNSPPNVPPSTEAGWNNSYWAMDTGHIGWGTNNSIVYHGGWRGPITYSPISAAYQFGFAFENANTGYALCLSSTPAMLPLEKTTDGGFNWTVTSYTPPSVSYGIKNAPHSGNYEYWIGGTTGIYYSSNGGSSWSTQYSLTAAAYCISMANYLRGWAGGATGQIWKYNVQGFGIKWLNIEVPSSYSLSQNYPNPFNPTTTINFAIPKTENVKLIVYNILGKEIAVLFNKKMNAGYHHVDFDGSKLPSGVYFYKLVAGEFTESMKMILAK